MHIEADVFTIVYMPENRSKNYKPIYEIILANMFIPDSRIPLRTWQHFAWFNPSRIKSPLPLPNSRISIEGSVVGNRVLINTWDLIEKFEPKYLPLYSIEHTMKELVSLKKENICFEDIDECFFVATKQDVANLQGPLKKELHPYIPKEEIDKLILAITLDVIDDQSISRIPWRAIAELAQEHDYLDEELIAKHFPSILWETVRDSKKQGIDLTPYTRNGKRVGVPGFDS